MIRAATIADAEPIARVHVAVWDETYRGKLPDHAIDGVTVQRRVTEWTEVLRSAESWTFVYEDERGVEGFVYAHRSGKEPGFDAYLSTLYILRSAQGRGVGRLLLARLASELTRNGISTMWLLTLRDENPARAFYERLGARLVREQPAPAALGEGVMDVVYGFADLHALGDDRCLRSS